MPTNRPTATRRRPDGADPLDAVSARIVACDACRRLRTYCERIGREKRAAYRDDTYWARPVPGFGDPSAQILVLGLAPAAHGANRTGRVFTGDGPGGSGDFLMTALHANGLANQPFSRSADDGLALTNVWISAAVRCAPPNNTPTPAEIARCHQHLEDELGALPRCRVIVALGRIAFDSSRRLLAGHAPAWPPRSGFAHGATFPIADGPTLVASYHPSRQNTQTGRLTPAMLREVFAVGKALAAGPR